MKRQPRKIDRSPAYADAVDALTERRSFLMTAGTLALGLSVCGAAGSALAGALDDPPDKKPPRLGGKIKMPDPVKITPDLITKLLKKRVPALEACYEEVLKKDPKCAGNIVLKTKIDGLGYTMVFVMTNTTKSSELQTCVEKAMGGLRFPRPVKDMVTFFAPLVFKQGGVAVGTPTIPDIPPEAKLPGVAPRPEPPKK